MQANASQPSMIHDVSMSMQHMPQDTPNNGNEYGFPMGFDPSFNMMAPQMPSDFGYYGVPPTGYHLNEEDTMMGSSQQYPPGTVWNTQ
jgi:hypothetical protein